MSAALSELGYVRKKVFTRACEARADAQAICRALVCRLAPLKHALKTLTDLIDMHDMVEAGARKRDTPLVGGKRWKARLHRPTVLGGGVSLLAARDITGTHVTVAVPCGHLLCRVWDAAKSERKACVCVHLMTVSAQSLMKCASI